MRHRGLEVVTSEVLTEALARTPPSHHVIWTGHKILGREGSLRSRALACVQEVARPVPLRTVLQRAAAIEDGAGFDPTCVRNAVRLHQGAKPAVYLLVERGGGGDFVAVVDIPFAGDVNRRIVAGEVVMDRSGHLKVAAANVSA